MFKTRAVRAFMNYGGVVHKLSSRGFAENPNDIAKRIASTKSIQKITKSMKMVSAAKLRGDTNRLMEGRNFGKGFEQLLNPVEVTEEEKARMFPLLALLADASASSHLIFCR